MSTTRHATRTVIGCVWAAHRTLKREATATGTEPPSYAWCEEQWNRHLRREAPDPGKTLPAWLTTALRDLWTGTRPAAPLQLGLFG